MVEWIKKLFYRYMMKLLFGQNKKRKSYHVTTWMDLEGIMLSDISDKDKYYMILFTCGIKKKKMKLINTEN